MKRVLLTTSLSALAATLLSLSPSLAQEQAKAPEAATAASETPKTTEAKAATTTVTSPPAPHATPAEAPLKLAEVLKKAEKVTAAAYPDAETALVDEAVQVRYLENGGYTTIDEEYTKVLTEEGRRGAREKSFSYNAFYGGVEILAVEVIKPGGKVISLDPKKISKEQVDRSQMSANIYDPNDKVIVLAIPSLEIGDMTRVYVKKWEAKARMAGTYSDWSVLESTQPIVSVSYEYIGPKSKPLRSKALLGKQGDTVKFTETEEGDNIRYRWEAKDVPQLFEEPGMPEYYTVGQRLLVSTVADWKEVSRWYWEISKGHLEKLTPEMKAKVSTLTASCNTEQERIKAIFKFVSQEIRYMGITTEKEAPGYEPHDVNLTFENRYGVCRDKAALLAAMLKEAGLEAFPVLISAGNKLDQEVPTPFFNHAITAVRGSDKKFTLMDSTDENTKDLLPQYLQDKSFLVATPEGETLMTSAVPPAADNMAKVKTEVKIKDDGSATGKCVMLFDGINDNVYRGHLAKAKPDDIRRMFERAVKGALPGGSLTSLKVLPENMMDTTQDLSVTLEFSAPSLLVSGGGTAQLDLPYMGSGASLVGRILAGSLGLDKRRFPLETQIACGFREDVVVTLPESLKDPLALPEYQNTKHQDFELNQEIGVADGKLSASTQLLLHSPTISPEGYLELKKAMARMEVNNRQEPVFARQAPAVMPPPVADVEVLETKFLLKADGSEGGKGYTFTTTTETRKKVLTFAGKKDNSELKFDYNPAQSEVVLDYAEVTQKDGTVRKIKSEEMNTLDASWNASAPRYPGAKTLVVSLPGVEIGSEIRYKYTRKDRQQPMFKTEFAFGSYDALNALEYTYDLPADLKFKSSQDFPAAGHVTEETKDGRHIISFKWNDLKPMARESSAPPLWVDQPDFIASAGKWETWISSLKAALAPHLAASEKVTAKAKELTADAKDAAGKIRAIRDFVAMQIRGEGPSFLALPFDQALSNAETTLADGYGHAADRAILLCALLQAAGQPAELALAARGLTEQRFLDRAQAFPSEDYYSSVVCRVKNPTNPEEWWPLDVLSQYAPLGATYLDDLPGRTLANETFVWKAPAGMKNDVQSHLEIGIDDQGTAQLEVVTKYFGAAQEGFIQQFKEMTPEELSRYHQSLISGLSQNARPTSKLQTTFDYPGVQRYSAAIQYFAIKAKDSLYFDLPAVPSMIFATDAETRRRPWMYASTNDSKFTWTVTLPGGLKPAIMPENIDWSGPGALGTVQFLTTLTPGEKNSKLDVVYETHTHPAVLPAGNYPDLLKLNQTFRHGSRRRVLLVKE